MKKILSILLSLLLLLSVIQPSMFIAFADDEPTDELVSTEVQMNGENPVDDPEEEPTEPVEGEEEEIPEPNKYVVTFHFNFDDCEDVQVEVEEGSIVSVPSIPERKGLEVNAWYDNTLCEGEAYDFDSPITASIDLYAKWAEIIYSVDYLNENGSSREVKISYNNKIDSSYVFQDSTLQSGWYFVEGNVTVANRVKISGDVHLILTDGCYIKFENGIHLLKGNSLTIYTQTDDRECMPSLDAYGHDNNAAIGTGGDNSAGTFTMCGGIINAISDQGAGVGGGRAHEGLGWANNGPDGATVNVYNGMLIATSKGDSAGIGGGKGGCINLNNGGNAPRGGAGGILNIYGGAVHAKSYGWQALGGGKYGSMYGASDGKAGDPITVNLYDASLVRLGEINEDREVSIAVSYSVTFHYMNSAFEDVSSTVLYGTAINKPEDKALPGKILYNWCYDSKFTRVYDFKTPVTRNIDLYANWKDDVSVVFIYQDKATSAKFVAVHYGSKVNKPADPTREGYTFVGWYDDFDYTDANKFDFNQPVTEELALYAGWAKNPTVTIDYNDSETEPTNTVIGYNTKPTKPSDPTRDGYTFMGWYDGPDYKQAKAFDFSKAITGNTVIYAGWERNPIVTFDYGEKFDSEQQSVSYGGIVTLPKTTVRDGMRVVGWYLDSNYSELFDDKQPILMDTTLYSKLENAIKYYDENGQEQVIESPCVTIDGGHGFEKTIIGSGWYFIKGNVTVGSRAEIKGDVKFVLENGAKVIFEQGIKLMSGNSLTIYTQSLNESEMGRLEAYGKDLFAAIGANGENTAGTFTMCGGIVTATADKGAGVGGGQGYAGTDWANNGPNGGTVNIYNGTLTASSNGYSAGIGGGRGGVSIGAHGLPVGGSGGTLNVYGGKIYASSKEGRAIGGGLGGEASLDTGKPGANATVNLKTEATVKGAFNKDKVVEIISAGSATGTFLSSGKVIIPAVIAVAALGAGAVVIFKKKKTN